MTWFTWIVLALILGGAAWLCSVLYGGVGGPTSCIGCGKCIAAGECVIIKKSQRKPAGKEQEPS